MLETSIDVLRRCPSTKVPNSSAEPASSSMYVPPMIAVASTERVSRYTQKVSANHKKLLVTLASKVLPTSGWKVDIAALGLGVAGPAVVVTRSSPS